jgi:ribosomal protein S12 methylthiotransferase
VPDTVKHRANELWNYNHRYLGFKPSRDKHLNALLKAYFVGRTEFDSPDVDNEVLIDASKQR